MKKKHEFKAINSIINFCALHSKLVTLVFFILAVAFPLVFNQQYYIAVGITCLMYATLSLSLNLITGYMGITCLGHAAFFGIGAYVAAILSTRFGITFLPNLVLGTVVAAAFGMLLGLPTLRIRGRYLAIVTLGFCEIMRIIELNWMSLTRGPQGISNIPKISFFGFECTKPYQKYYVVLGCMIVVILIIRAIMNSRIGRAISAIRDDEVAAEAMGINVFAYKVMVFAISAGLAGFIGVFYAHYMSFISPNEFDFNKSITVLSMTIMGGMASIPGSIFGASVLSILPEALRFISDYRQIVYGLVLVIMVVWRPNGILGDINLTHIRQRLQFAKEQGNATAPPAGTENGTEKEEVTDNVESDP